jgi:hypothetical protein
MHAVDIGKVRIEAAEQCVQAFARERVPIEESLRHDVQRSGHLAP